MYVGYLPIFALCCGIRRYGETCDGDICLPVDCQPPFKTSTGLECVAYAVLALKKVAHFTRKWADPLLLTKLAYIASLFSNLSIIVARA